MVKLEGMGEVLVGVRVANLSHGTTKIAFLKVDLGVSRRLIFHYDREVGENFKKIHNSLYYVSDSQKKIRCQISLMGFAALRQNLRQIV